MVDVVFLEFVTIFLFFGLCLIFFFFLPYPYLVFLSFAAPRTRIRTYLDKP
ncbi:hypothetical protein HanIR_Chr02g0073601 [Helianthus annuus]|nr:hypothetical protein HanIR_Chr02g0073601 [Helianthus annuus]